MRSRLTSRNILTPAMWCPNLAGVSVRTLQGWEQGRKQPSGAARTLLAIARTNPKALLDVADR
jgi:putative transcriptional regulator